MCSSRPQREAGPQGAVCSCNSGIWATTRGATHRARTPVPSITAVRMFHSLQQLIKQVRDGQGQHRNPGKRMRAEPRRCAMTRCAAAIRSSRAARATPVQKLQTRLKELGYYKGKRDGVYGGVVASALRCSSGTTKLYPSGHRLHHDALGSSSGDKPSAIRYKKIEARDRRGEWNISHEPYVLGESGPPQV